MRVKDRTLGAWFNHKRFSQRKAKGYTLSKRFDHRLSRLLSWLLFKLLPPEWYLRTQGIKLPTKVPVLVKITYLRQGETDGRQARVRLGRVDKVKVMLSLWFEHGFCEPVPELSPFIPRHLDNKRYCIPPGNILKVEWYDPILRDDVSINGPGWESE